MTAPIAVTTLRRTIEEWLSKDDGQPALALRAAAQWAGESTFEVSGQTVKVVPCPTTLAMRAALVDRAPQERLVLLTTLSDRDVGDGLRAHLSRFAVKRVDIWSVVEGLFGGLPLEPGARKLDWLGESLIDRARPGGWPRPTGTLVTLDHALRCLAAEVLGIERQNIDVAGLLRWTENLEPQQAFVALPDPVRDGLTKYLSAAAGAGADPVMAAANARHGVDVIPLGLLATILWPTGPGKPGAEVLVARARLEPRFGGRRFPDEAMRAFAAAAEAWLDRARDDNLALARDKTNRTEQIACEIGAESLLGGSVRLPAGFQNRMRTFADAVRIAVPRGGGVAVEQAVARAEAALRALEEHRWVEAARLKRAHMAVRLLRWLSTVDAPAPLTLHGALLRQVREDGWVDRARLAVMAGDPEPEVAAVYGELHAAVDTRRSLHDQQFARLLAADTAADADPGRLLRVEDVLATIVKPILEAKHRVLLVLLDGMSTAAAAELAESVTGNGSWRELTPDGEQRVGVLAALPTVTRVSRCSLFSGRIAVGDQDEERANLAAAVPGAALEHKRKLRSGAGWMLPQDLIDTVQSNRALVATVVNTIDDALDRGDPATAEWTEDRLEDLRALLTIAGDRVVVLLSDHGHVADRGSDAVTLRSASAENRWRPADRPPGSGEILLAGRRVAMGEGRIVAPWRENIRYGPRKAGYHGGVSAAEAVIPLIVLTNGKESAGRKPIPGWEPAPVASPGWWREPVGGASIAMPAANRVTRPSAAAKPSPGQESLFGDGTGPADRPAQPTVVDEVLDSAVFRARHDSSQLAVERVRALLGALVSAPQQRMAMETLAERANVPAHRIRGIVAALRKLLQVEGYPVLTVDPDSSSVRLDLGLLRDQFGIGR